MQWSFVESRKTDCRQQQQRSPFPNNAHPFEPWIPIRAHKCRLVGLYTAESAVHRHPTLPKRESAAYDLSREAGNFWKWQYIVEPDDHSEAVAASEKLKEVLRGNEESRVGKGCYEELVEQ